MRFIKNKYGEIRPWISIPAVFAAMVAVSTLVGFLQQLLNIGQEQLLVNFFVTMVIYAANALIILLAFRLFYRRHWREMGFAKPGAIPQIILGLVFGAVSIAVVAGILILSGQASVTDIEPARMLSFPFWIGLFQFILVGVYEELICRGFMMTALKTSRNKYIIMLPPALIFAVLHIFNPNVTFFSLVNTVLVGILFAYLMVKTGRIWVSIGYHIAWNFVQGNVLGIAVSGGMRQSVMNISFTGTDWFTGGAFGAEGGAACTLVLLLGLLFIRFCVKTPAERSWTFESGLPMPMSKGIEDKVR